MRARRRPLPPGIRERESGGVLVYDARYEIGGGKQRSKVCASLDEAVEFRAGRRRDRLRGGSVRAEPSKQLVADFLEDWFRRRSMPGDLRATTVKRWGPWIDKLIVPYLGDLRLCDLSRARVLDSARRPRRGSAGSRASTRRRMTIP